MSFTGSKPVFEGCFHDEELVDFAQNGRNRPKAGIDSIKDYTRVKTTWFYTSDEPSLDPFSIR